MLLRAMLPVKAADARGIPPAAAVAAAAASPSWSRQEELRSAVCGSVARLIASIDRRCCCCIGCRSVHRSRRFHQRAVKAQQLGPARQPTPHDTPGHWAYRFLQRHWIPRAPVDSVTTVHSATPAPLRLPVPPSDDE